MMHALKVGIVAGMRVECMISQNLQLTVKKMLTYNW